MDVFVKICGLHREIDVERVATLRPDAMGFVFWPSSKRNVEPAQVREWTRDLPPEILKVGVFVDLDPEGVERIAECAGLDVVQLHGSETPEICSQVSTCTWKAIHLDRDPATEVSGYQVDAFLVDSYSAESPGGTGKTVHWGRAAEFVAEQSTPVVLAGGLTPENVRESIFRTRPWGVDVSSGVEVRPGEKDPKKVEEFILQCRSL
jgi:phosphoribosylanthranilate isomerase